MKASSKRKEELPRASPTRQAFEAPSSRSTTQNDKDQSQRVSVASNTTSESMKVRFPSFGTAPFQAEVPSSREPQSRGCHLGCPSSPSHRANVEKAHDPKHIHRSKIAEHDVLFGRGKGLHCHSGNKRMRGVIDKYREQYHDVQRSKKSEVVQEAYTKIIAGGVKFLTHTACPDFFSEVGTEVAIQKVRSTLRCKKGYVKAKMARAASMSMAHRGIAPPTAVIAEAGRSLGNGVDMPPPASFVPGGLSRDVLAQARRNTVAEPLQMAPALNSGAFSGFSSMSSITIPSMLQTILGYYNVLRREQLLREAALLQRMEDASVINAARQTYHWLSMMGASFAPTKISRPPTEENAS